MNGRNRIRILVVDDDVPIRVGLRTILESEPDMTVVGEAADGLQAVRLAESLRPDVVLMDVQMRNLDGIEATRRIVADDAGRDDTPRVVVLTTFEHDEYVYGALSAGASAFLLKRAPAEELVDAVRVVAAGEALLNPELTRRLIAAFSERDTGLAPDISGVSLLTQRECEVLVLIARGMSNREIAAELTIGLETVKTHAKRIFMKLGVRDRAQAVVVAYEARLVVPGA